MSEAELDTTVVEFHRAPEPRLEVRALEGRAWLIRGSNGPAEALELGAPVQVGDTVVLAEGSRALIGAIALRGGRRGTAHAFVRKDAFAPSPTRDDVARLLAELEALEARGEPLPHEAPRTPARWAAAAELARANLAAAAARALPEAVSRELGAVLLFISEETAHVALAELAPRRLAALIRALDRPVSPHLVEPRVIAELQDRVYGPRER